MKKRKTTPKKSKNKIPKKSYIYYINILIAIFSVILFAFFVNEFLLKDSPTKQTPELNTIEKNIITKTPHDRFEEQTNALEIEYVDEPYEEKQPIITKKPKSIFHFEEDTKEQDKTIEDEPIIKKVVVKSHITPKIQTKKIKKIDTRPKLAILIDDVTTASQIRKIKNIGFPITMAFLPPTSIHKNSAKIVKNLDIYMIHLPLEAGTRRYEETNTLHTNSSYNEISKRISALHYLYPKARYINNHTGSKFTSNHKAMDKLFKVLSRYNLTFVDSRTTAKTVAKRYAKKYNVSYLSRNIFLDNKQDKFYIQKQLKKAIKIARKSGRAVAIGHPHSITLKTLKNSKYLLKGIHLVYINHYDK
jgi:hypothetical protein